MNAKGVMTKDVITFSSETTACEAIDLLLEHRISGAPVVDAQGCLLGIVSEKDLIVSADFLGMVLSAKTKVGDFMTKDGVVSFTEDAPIEEVGRALVRHNIKRVPILKDKRVIGIVSRRDVLRYMRQADVRQGVRKVEKVEKIRKSDG
jgi:predicted transcriptional regulator